MALVDRAHTGAVLVATLADLHGTIAFFQSSSCLIFQPVISRNDMNDHVNDVDL